MNKDNDDNKNSLRGKAMRAFRAVALPVLATAAMMGGMVQTAEAQTYNNGRQATTVSYNQQQVDPARPWLQDQNYQEQMHIYAEQSRLRMVQYEQQARATRASYEASIMQYRKGYADQLRALRKSGTAKWTDYGALAQNLAYYETQHKTNLTYVNTNLEQTRLNEAKYLKDQAAGLDYQYANTEPYRSMVAEYKARQTERVTTAVQRSSNQPLSDAEQQARLRQAEQDRIARQTRAYQDAQLEAVKNGTAMPKREDFGLPPERVAGNNATGNRIR